MSARFPVITGLGIVSATGCGVEENWRAIAAGQCGLKSLTLFPSPRYGQDPVGEIRIDLAKFGAERGSRTDKLGWIAAREAVAAAKIGPALRDCGEQAGIILGGSVGGSFDSEKFLTTLIKDRKFQPRPTRFHECVSTVDLIADEFGLFGPGFAVSTACSSGAMAIATAAEMILSGEADVMLAGGADSLSRITWGGFHSLLLVDSAGCRPFDANRAGMSLGEGAAILILESEEFARRRGTKILARLAGWGASCDAFHVTAPHPEGAGALAAMQSALRRANLEPAAIDYVNAHGTGTRDNDLAESNALKKLFGGNVPPFSSTKRFLGHALAASGAMEAVICVEALRQQQIPPNPGFEKLDPAIGIQPVTELQRSPLTHVMSNSFGFGGNNAVLIFSKPEIVPRTLLPKPSTVAVSGLGVIAPAKIHKREIEPPLPPEEILARDCGVLDASSLTPNQRRRLSRMSQMTILAARQSHSPVPAENIAVAIGTGFGCLDEGAAFIENLISKDEREPMPARFSGSVHNSPAGQVAIDLDARGLNSAPTAGEISFEAALWQGIRQLQIGEADGALAGAVDELNKYPMAIGKRWKIWNEKIIPGEGAVVAKLGRMEQEKPFLARVAALKLGRWRKPFDAGREANWITSAIDLKRAGIILSGAPGFPFLNKFYNEVIAGLSARAGRKLEHQTYKQFCGEFYSASAFGFSIAVKLVRERKCGVLLYTLSSGGGKAICLIES